MNVRELREFLVDVDGDVEVVVPARDHRYAPARVETQWAETDRQGGRSEFHGPVCDASWRGGDIVPVLVIA